ncbi:MAG TPA: hypothetical protein VHB77_11760 [Planctomycetaceae bacterium]|nr:hypothetical protein [Planctomycetaceae bacterium]
MESNLTVELTDTQRELLIEGLRFVRSARKLAFRDPLASTDEQREADLRQVAALMDRLNAAPVAKSTSKV